MKIFHQYHDIMMFWTTPSGEKLMEYCFVNITPTYVGFELSNKNLLNRIRVNKLKKKCEQLIHKIENSLIINPQIELDELRVEIKIKNDDFWDALLNLCTISCIIEAKKNHRFDISKCINSSIGLFTRTILEYSKDDEEIVGLKYEKFKLQLEMEMLFVPVLYKKAT